MSTQSVRDDGDIVRGDEVISVRGFSGPSSPLYIPARGEKGATITLQHFRTVGRRPDGSVLVIEVGDYPVRVQVKGGPLVAILPPTKPSTYLLAWDNARWRIAATSEDVIDGTKLS